jgi:DNA-binding NtrC family response regulator
MDAPRVLIVDDEPAMLENCERILSSEGYACTTLADPRRFRDVAAACEADIVITDLRMPGVDGMTILAAAVADDPSRPVIIMTGFATVTAAVSAVREGAFDFVTKPFAADQLLVAVDRAVRYRGLTVENRALRTQVARASGGAGILGSSTVMARLLDQAARVAATDANVLLTGESGTGKELFARFVHARSPRKDRAFVPVDCAAMPEGLLESELFGHKRGAFTGAVQEREGLLAQAKGGTVFLDEIGEMPITLQVKLLRVLEQRQMRALGDSRLIDLDIRVVAATNRDLAAAVAAGTFREDLYYRLNVVGFHLPALRERADDLAVLLNAFLAEFALAAKRRPPRVTPAAWALLERHQWPGNVRELRNVAQRLVVLDTDGQIAPEDLPEPLRSPAPVLATVDDAWPLRYEEARDRALAAFRLQYVTRMLESHGGNVSRAAIAAGVSRRTFHRWLAAEDGEEGEPMDEETRV